MRLPWEALRTKGVRIYKGKYGDWSVAQSLQPEYIAVANNSLKAWVSLEVNNAVAVLDIENGQITDILPLGVKDHRLKNSGFVSWNGGESSNGFDASDQDNKINIANWPVFGMYQPDAMEAYKTLGRTYWVTANEGTYFKFGKDKNNKDVDERVRVREISSLVPPLLLDPSVFSAAILDKKQLGNLKVSNWQGYDADMDGDYDALYAFSSRSFSIWSEEGELVFDSGDDFERIQELAHPEHFNCDDNSNVVDDKSDDQGVQPDGLTIGKLYGRHGHDHRLGHSNLPENQLAKVDSDAKEGAGQNDDQGRRYYVFVVLQRIGGIMVYDITDPNIRVSSSTLIIAILRLTQPRESRNRRKALHLRRIRRRRLRQGRGSRPEGVLFISEADSPTKEPLLVVANQTAAANKNRYKYCLHKDLLV